MYIVLCRKVILRVYHPSICLLNLKYFGGKIRLLKHQPLLYGAVDTAATLSAVNLRFILGVIFCLWPKTKSCSPEGTECPKDSPLNPPGCLWVVVFSLFSLLDSYT